MFIDDSLLRMIVEETNLYSVRKDGASVNTTLDEMQQFIGILLTMGIIKMPAYRDYWSERLRYPFVADVMPLNRFKKLRRMIHFVSEEDPDDRFSKVRRLFDHFRKNLLKVEDETKQSIDEMMVPYKGTRAGNLRQYVQPKPHKWGFKLFIRAGVSGMVYDILPYAGKDTFCKSSFTSEEEALGVGGKVVVDLCRTVQQPQHSAVFFDNYFCSIELVKYLEEKVHIKSLGTIRKARVRGCPLQDDKALTKNGRGSVDQQTDKNSGVTMVKWVDNKVVCLCSNFVGVQPLGSVKRYSKEEKSKVAITSPRIVLEYNAHMGGVDLADMLIELYRTPLKSKRYYLRLFAQILDIGVNNAWLLYRRECNLLGVKDDLALKDFRSLVSDALMRAHKPKRGRPSCGDAPSKKIKHHVQPRPSLEVRYDGVGHWPVFGKKGRCRHCPTGQTQVQCTKCAMNLCFVPDRNCFLHFHQQIP